MSNGCIDANDRNRANLLMKEKQMNEDAKTLLKQLLTVRSSKGGPACVFDTIKLIDMQIDRINSALDALSK